MTKRAGVWDEPSFHAAADRNVSELVKRLEAELRANPFLELRYNGEGKEPTCNVCLRAGGDKLFWIWGDGKYQWSWEGFRGTEPEVVRAFQAAVDSDNPSSRYITKPGAVVKLTTAEILAVLMPVAKAGTEARGN